MRNIYFRLLVAILACFAQLSAVQATEVNLQQAREKAKTFILQRISEGYNKSGRRSASQLQMQAVETGQPLVYAFNANGGGYVLVSGDDCAPDILGFGDSGSFDPDDIPEGMRYLLSVYQEQITQLKEQGQRAAPIADLGEKIAPLVTSRWGQRAPYNYLCPTHVNTKKKSKPRELSLTGCPATAMAQVMYYYKYPAAMNEYPAPYTNSKYNMMEKCPEKGLTLDWGLMMDYYGDRGNPTGTEDQQMAVAKLMAYCGYNSCMSYSPYASGAWDSAVRVALINNFNYDAEMKQVYRGDYVYADWIKMMYSELKDKRPIIYTGFSSTGGHTFVCDGYSHEDFFHFNWGWYGSSDNYYRMALCNPSSLHEGGGSDTQGYSGRQDALIGIKPATTPGKVAPKLQSNFSWHGKRSVTRSDENEDFNLTRTISQNIYNNANITDPVSFGYVVTDASGKVVSEKKPISSAYSNLSLKNGRFYEYWRKVLKLGDGLGDGQYRMEFLVKYGEGEWEPVMKQSSNGVTFVIKGNTLTYDCRPDYLDVEVSTEVFNDDEKVYQVNAKLKNTSTTETFKSFITVKTIKGTSPASSQKQFVEVGPGESWQGSLIYNLEKGGYSNVVLFSEELGSPIGEGRAIDYGQKNKNASLQIVKSSLTDDVKDGVLKADDSYSCTVTVKNAGTEEFYGYLKVTDESDEPDEEDDDDDDSDGDLVRLKPGATHTMNLTLSRDEYEHVVTVGYIDDEDEFVTLYESKPFVIQPHYQITAEKMEVTPVKEVEDELADYEVTSEDISFKAVLKNAETTEFKGTIILQRYYDDYSNNWDDDDTKEPDQMFLKPVTIPAGGTVNFEQAISLKGLAKENGYSQTIGFDIMYVREGSGDMVFVGSSDDYLIIRGTTGIRKALRTVGEDNSAWYSINGHRLTTKPSRGLYIKGGKKIFVK